MRKPKPPFVKPSKNNDAFYDLIGDYELIEASFAQQYGIRLRREDMPWGEFLSLLAGLNEKTPLGRIVSIRAETDPKVIRDFSPDQKRIRNEWLRAKSKKTAYTKEEYAAAMKNFENMFIALSK